jgi:hypothetical protein
MIVVDIMTWWFLHKYQVLKNVFLCIFYYPKLDNNKIHSFLQLLVNNNNL